MQANVQYFEIFIFIKIKLFSHNCKFNFNIIDPSF